MANTELLGTDSVSGSVASVTVNPRPMDILVGKEVRARRHKGSRLFSVYVEGYRERYEEAINKQKRAAITREMYSTIKQANIRFLKFSAENNGWVEIGSVEARDKITHALRFSIKRANRKDKKHLPQRQSSDSTHRSETSATSGTSYDWDQLLSQQQRHLAGMGLGNMSGGLLGSRSSFSSAGSASYLSRDLSKDLSRSSSHGSSHHRSAPRAKSSKKISFSIAEPSVCSAGLSTIYSASTKSTKSSKEAASAPKKPTTNGNSESAPTNSLVTFFSVAEPSVCSTGLSTIYSASTKSTKSSKASATRTSPASSAYPSSTKANNGSEESAATDALELELFGTRRFDMHRAQSNVDQQIDKPPRMPSRPTEEDEDDLESSMNNGFQTLMDTNDSGFEMLGPLPEFDQENMRDSDSGGGSQSDHREMEQPTAELDHRELDRVTTELDENRLELNRSGEQHDSLSLQQVTTATGHLSLGSNHVVQPTAVITGDRSFAQPDAGELLPTNASEEDAVEPSGIGDQITTLDDMTALDDNIGLDLDPEILLHSSADVDDITTLDDNITLDLDPEILLHSPTSGDLATMDLVGEFPSETLPPFGHTDNAPQVEGTNLEGVAFEPGGVEYTSTACSAEGEAQATCDGTPLEAMTCSPSRHEPDRAVEGTVDYSDLLLQEPLLDW